METKPLLFVKIRRLVKKFTKRHRYCHELLLNFMFNTFSLNKTSWMLFLGI
jgi:hypothetical protein